MGIQKSESDAGFGTVSRTETMNLLPEELERMRKLHDIGQPAGTTALSTEYIFIGIEGTGETTREERAELARQGISSRPIGWGVEFSRRIERSI